MTRLPKHSFPASCRTLLLISMPMLVGWAWKDFLRQAVWDQLEHHAAGPFCCSTQPSHLILSHFISFADETMLTMLRLGFALASTLAVVLLTNSVNELFPTSPTKDAGFMGIRFHGHRWNMLRMVSKSLSVFVSWCWDALAKQSGVMMR